MSMFLKYVCNYVSYIKTIFKRKHMSAPGYMKTKGGDVICNISNYFFSINGYRIESSVTRHKVHKIHGFRVVRSVNFH